MHTESRTKGIYRLLILDGHSSHATPEFDRYCTTNKIITLCMPPHTSHLLQPLDVSCFAPLKRSYGKEVQELVRCGIQHIDKEDFLAIYRTIRPTVFTKQNIESGFRATGLLPYEPQRVLSSLTVTKTLSPPGTSDGLQSEWTAETPHNTSELENQTRLVQELLQRSSQSPVNQAVTQIIKGCHMAMHQAVLLTKEVQELRTVNARRERKRQYRRRYLSYETSLQAQQGQFLLDRVENRQQEAGQGGQAVVRQRALPTCSRCGIKGHTVRTCLRI